MDEGVWKRLDELSPAARLLIAIGVTLASVAHGILATLWIAYFVGRVGALEIQAEAARTERADFAEEFRRRDEEFRRRDEEFRRRDEECRQRDDEIL